MTSPQTWRNAWRRGGPIDWALRVLCAVYLALLTASALEQFARAVLGTSLTTVGAGLAPIADGSPKPLFPVVSIVPGSTADRAGIIVGDRLRYIDNDPNFAPTRLVGQHIGILVEHAGVRRTMIMTVTKVPPAPIDVLFPRIAFVFILVIAGLLFVRGWWRQVPMLLALALTAPINTSTVFVAPLWLSSSPWVAGVTLALVRCASIVAAMGLPAFAMRLYEAQHCPLPRWHWAVLATMAIVLVVDTQLILSVPVFGPPIDLRGSFNTLFAILIGLTQGCVVVAAGYLILGWLRSRGNARNQYRVLLIAFLILPLVAVFEQIAQLLGESSDTAAFSQTHNLLYVIAYTLYPTLLAYAMLRQKLVDVGFIINRALVYGSVSALLLVTFGLIEWAADELIKEQSRVESVAIEASVALAIFLVFHRVRDFVEEHLEAIFFRSWHENEAVLKRFIGDASFISRADRLEAAFCAELTRFSGGALVSLYATKDRGGYVRLAGAADMPEAIDQDDALAVALRARRMAIEAPDLAGAALALPMVHRAELLGFVALGPKPSGDAYRPDEIAELSRAAHQIGLDLDALRVEEIEHANIALERENEALRREMTVMRDALAGPGRAVAS